MLNVKAIFDQRHANVSIKTETLLADDPRHSLDYMTGKCFPLRNELQQKFMLVSSQTIALKM